MGAIRERTSRRGQVLYTYDVRGHVERPMGEVEWMHTVRITTGDDLLPRLYWMPTQQLHNLYKPFSMWVVRWPSSM